MSVDVRCYELAEVFLADSDVPNNPANREELAREIQSAIEDWLNVQPIPKGDRDSEGGEQ